MKSKLGYYQLSGWIFVTIYILIMTTVMIIQKYGG